MPRQNRVDPFGSLIATLERGTFMGNRGILHDEFERIKRPWMVKRWLVCVLEFRGRKRTVMKPNSYTELFFLDEATALAAGHRPCAECRHKRFIDFCTAWKIAFPTAGGSSRPTADEMDNQLHVERIAKDRSKPLFVAKLEELPNGVFVQRDEWGDRANLVWGDKLFPWTFGGYAKPMARPTKGAVLVVTPRSTVEVIRAGYVPAVHLTAGKLA
jgi:hypothetical protein